MWFSAQSLLVRYGDSFLGVGRYIATMPMLSVALGMGRVGMRRAAL